MVSARQVYERILIELRKYKAPHIHLDQFLYFINKGIQETINDSYNLYSTSQQMDDALSSLAVPAEITIDWLQQTYTINPQGITPTTHTFLMGKKYGYDYMQFALPENYWHLLNMFVTTETKRHYKCHPPGYQHTNTAKRLTADAKAAISNNAFLAPDLKRPYFYTQDGLITPNTLDFQVYYGDGASVRPVNIEFDYLKKPQQVNLTVAQRDAISDTSQQLEFPDYVVGEIIKKVVALLLENTKDPRIQTMPPVNQSIKG